MRKSSYKFLFIVFSILLPITVVNAQDYEFQFKKIQELAGIEEYLYQPNGMKVILIQDNSAPVVTVQIVYQVGSKHEVTGNTGSTHLLEHMNFKGTPTFNKKKGNAIFSVLEGIGAQMNATTWLDRTNYFETIPSDKIELALHIEADRMRNSLLLKEDKDAEMTVVRNEFERAENNPSGILNKEIWSTAYMAHPYHHPTIGWRSDIENMPIEVLRDFYNTYYWPDNATLTIVGDFKKEELFTLVDKYFGQITKSPHEIKQPYTTEPEQLGPRRIIIKRPGQLAMVSIAFKIPGVLHNDSPALDVLSQIMGSGTSSIISKTFVDQGHAVYGAANTSNFKEAGLFTISLAFSPDKNAEDVNKQLLEMVEKVKSSGISQDDLARVVAKLNTQTILSRDGSESIASELTEAIAAGDWTQYVKGSERLSKVTVEDVKRVANFYLADNQSTTGYFLPDNTGDNQEVNPSVSGFKKQTISTEEESKFYFRNPNEHFDKDITPILVEEKNLMNSFLDYQEIRSSVSKYLRKEVSGVDVVTVKTGAKGFITVAASFPIAGTGKKLLISTLTVGMLSKGTKLHNKFKFSEKLENLGVNIKISSDMNNVNIRFKCLAKDMEKVVSLLAEELRQPLFDSKELELLKQQLISSYKDNLTNPATLGSIALSQAMYSEGHPNYSQDIGTTVLNIETITTEDIKAFYKAYFGTNAMHLVAVGDVNEKKLYAFKSKFFRLEKRFYCKGFV